MKSLVTVHQHTAQKGGHGIAPMARVAIRFQAAEPSPNSGVNSTGDAVAHAPRESAMPEYPMEMLFVRPYPRWKRVKDIVGALVLLVTLAPVMLAVAIGVKLTSKGPVLFRQVRGGHGGRTFVVYKFRSMVVDAEARKKALMAFNERNGPAFKMKHDPRVTSFGRFIRKTSLDELPQLFNVLKGDMALVGPRPLPFEEGKDYEPWQRRRLEVKPGLTCIWQITSRDEADFARWMRLDLKYIKKHSPLYDIKLLLRTIPAVLLRRGAH
jgi:lipopolysaccharide/colanic/teichoic acid biosynthesis glycosyltransferase